MDYNENWKSLYWSSPYFSDVVASPWQSNPETNQKLRQVTYTLTLPPNSFGPKVSHVTETQVRFSNCINFDWVDLDTHLWIDIYILWIILAGICVNMLRLTPCFLPGIVSIQQTWGDLHRWCWGMQRWHSVCRLFLRLQPLVSDTGVCHRDKTKCLVSSQIQKECLGFHERFVEVLGFMSKLIIIWC